MKASSLLLIFFIATLSQISLAQEKVLARIGKKNVSVSDFNARYEQNTRLAPAGAKPSRQEVLDNVINFELAVQEARKEKIHLEKSIQDQINILLYQEMIKRQLQPKIDSIKITEGQLRDYYKKNPLIRTRQIMFLTRPDMSQGERKDVENEAQRVLKKLKSEKKEFAQMAREYSEGPSAKSGGDVEWGARHKLLSEYYDAALALKTPGKVSNVVESAYGYHIIQLTGIRDFSKMDAVYRDFIIRALKEEKGEGLYKSYFEALRGKYPVSINESLL